jgi:hypothetical protein
MLCMLISSTWEPPVHFLEFLRVWCQEVDNRHSTLQFRLKVWNPWRQWQLLFPQQGWQQHLLLAAVGNTLGVDWLDSTQAWTWLQSNKTTCCYSLCHYVIKVKHRICSRFPTTSHYGVFHFRLAWGSSTQPGVHKHTGDMLTSIKMCNICHTLSDSGIKHVKKT